MTEASMFWDIVFLAAALPLVLSYFGYPFLLRIMLIRQRRDQTPAGVGVASEDAELPRVSLLVAVYNEEAVIEEKIRNFLELDYPRDRVDLSIVSDCSSDRTCELATRLMEGRSEQDRARVRIHDRRTRSGKTIALSETVPLTTGEVIVFTDANTMYHPDALRRLAERFRDPGVGLVCGNLQYTGGDEAGSGGEALYWRYENWIKRWEGELGQLLVANGSIYAFRREVFEPIPGPVADDMVLPLLASTRGYRTIYAEDAVAEERLPEYISEDFRAKARIVAQGFEAVRRYRHEVFASGLFRTTQYLLHKILRWMAPFFMVLMLLSSVAGGSILMRQMLLLQFVFYSFTLMGFLLRNTRTLEGAARIPFYFFLVNAAALKGFVDFARGRARASWEKSESTRGEPAVSPIGRAGARRDGDGAASPAARHDAVIMTLSPTGLALARSLAARGVTCWGISSDRAEIGHRSRWVRQDPALCHLETGPRLLEGLLAFGKARPRPPVLYTAGDGYIDFVAENHEVLREHFILMDSVRPEVSSFYMNKQTFYGRCQDLGIAMPRTFFPKTAGDAQQAAAALRYPAIVKPTQGHLFRQRLGGDKLVEARDSAALLLWWQRFQDWGGETVLQEAIPGPETNIFVGGLYTDANGEVRSLFTARKYRQYPPTYGSGSYMESCWSEEIAELSVDLVTKLAYRGICGTEFKWDPRDEEWKLIELNPRPTLWYALPHAAGVDIAWDAHCDLTGHPNPVHIDCQDDRMRWQLPVRDLLSSVQLLREGELGLLELLHTTVNPWRKRYGDLELRDPAMLIAMLVDAASKYRRYVRGTPRQRQR